MLASDHTLSLIAVFRCAGIVGEGGRPSLFGLQQQDIPLGSSLEQQNPGPGADTAYPDYLVRNVGEAEVIQQDPAVRLEGLAIGGHESTEPRTHGIGIHIDHVIQPDDQRRIADDLTLSIDDCGQLSCRLQAVAGVCLC